MGKNKRFSIRFVTIVIILLLSFSLVPVAADIWLWVDFEGGGDWQDYLDQGNNGDPDSILKTTKYAASTGEYGFYIYTKISSNNEQWVDAYLPVNSPYEDAKYFQFHLYKLKGNDPMFRVHVVGETYVIDFDFGRIRTDLSDSKWEEDYGIENRWRFYPSVSWPSDVWIELDYNLDEVIETALDTPGGPSQFNPQTISFFSIAHDSIQSQFKEMAQCWDNILFADQPLQSIPFKEAATCAGSQDEYESQLAEEESNSIGSLDNDATDIETVIPQIEVNDLDYSLSHSVIFSILVLSVIVRRKYR